MAYKIQHLKLGGILDQAIAITKDHFGLLFGIMLCGVIPYYLIAGLFQISITPELPAQPSMEDYLAAQAEIQKYWPINLGLVLLENLVILPLTNAAVITAVAQVYLGDEATVLGSIKYAFSRFWPLLGTTILMGLAIMGGLILLIIPGILFAIWFGLAQHVVMIEGLSGQKALGRSKEIVRPHMGTFLILGIMLFVLALFLGLSINFIPQQHLAVVATALINAVLTILSTATIVVFYFSCRCAIENFDLEYLASSIESDAPVADEGVVGPSV